MSIKGISDIDQNTLLPERSRSQSMVAIYSCTAIGPLLYLSDLSHLLEKLSGQISEPEQLLNKLPLRWLKKERDGPKSIKVAMNQGRTDQLKRFHPLLLIKNMDLIPCPTCSIRHPFHNRRNKFSIFIYIISKYN